MAREFLLNWMSYEQKLLFPQSWFKRRCKTSRCSHMDVSLNGGTPKSSILIRFSITNHPFWGFSHYFWKHPYWKKSNGLLFHSFSDEPFVTGDFSVESPWCDPDGPLVMTMWPWWWTAKMINQWNPILQVVRQPWRYSATYSLMYLHCIYHWNSCIQTWHFCLHASFFL